MPLSTAPRSRIARAVALAAFLSLGAAGSASAHALYERSEPASGGRLQAPGQLQIWFTEAIEIGFTKVQILDSARRAASPEAVGPVPDAPRALVATVGALPDGAYMISWQALSAVDGHVTKGVFPLVVGSGDLSTVLEEAPAFVPSVGDVAARWLSYLAALALAGGFLFRVAVLAPALVGPGRMPDRTDVLGAFDARFRRFGLAATAALIAASLVGMAFQAATAADLPVWQALGEPLLRLLPTRLGLLWQARLALAAVIGLLLWRAPARVRWWGGVAIGLLLLAAISLNSHAAALPSATWLAVGLDWLHQVAAAAWVGGLFALALLVPRVLRPLRDAPRTRVLAAVVPRFSGLAIAAVAILALSGAFQSWLQVASWEAFATLYGGSLLVKLGLLVPLLLLGAANLLLARPRFAEAAAARGRRIRTGVPTLVPRFRWAVAAEAVLGVGVLLATAVLTASEPARETHARRPRPIELAGLAEDVPVAVRIAPGRPGANAFDVRLVGTDGQPVPDVQRVTLRFTYLDEDLGSGNLVLEPRDAGGYGAVGSHLTTEGHWLLETLVRRRGQDDVRAAFRIHVDSPEQAGRPPSLEALPLPSSASPGRAVAVALVLLAAGSAAWGTRLRASRSRRAALYAASVALALLGAVLYARTIDGPTDAADAHADEQPARNPISPDAASLASGKALYEQNCATCHGATGRGDGPLAAALNPRPADFREHMEAGHSDGELYAWVAKGVPGTGMPAFEDRLSETDRWHIINYIRGFASQSP
jgi:copper transport protein